MHEHADADAARQNDGSERFAVECARLLADDKCDHVVLLDVRGLSQLTDYIVIGSGRSDRQMAATLDHACELGETMGHACLRTSTDDRTTWLLADFADVMVHLFEPGTREHYDLEMLWGDAERPAWRRTADSTADSTAYGTSESGANGRERGGGA